MEFNTEQKIRDKIRKARRDGTSIAELITDIDMNHLNDTDKETEDLIIELAIKDGLFVFGRD